MLMSTCKDTSVWIIRLQDERLPMLIRVRLNMHLMICNRCREFKRQMHTLKQGVNDWREQTDR